MKNILMGVGKTVVTALLFYFLFRKIDFREFWATLRNARMSLLIAGFMLLWIGHYICIFRWRILMRPLMTVPPFREVLAIYCIGLFFNLAFPTVVGGDVVRMYYAGKRSRQYARSFAATFLDRDAGMLAMMVIACIATINHPSSIPGIPVSWIVWGAFFTFLLVNLAFFTPRAHNLFSSLLHRLHLSRFTVKLDALSMAFRIMGKERIALGLAFVISLVNQLIVIAVVWVTSEGLRLNVSMVYFLLFVPVITLISMIPVSLNGMGLREFAFVSLFTAIGVPHPSAVVLGLLSSVVIVLSAIPGGVVYVFFRSRTDTQDLAAVEADYS